MQAKKLVKNKNEIGKNQKNGRHERIMASEVESKIDDLELLTPEFLADFLGLSKQALSHWRAANIGPEFVRVGNKAIRYPKKELLEWLEENRVRPNKWVGQCINN